MDSYIGHIMWERTNHLLKTMYTL